MTEVIDHKINDLLEQSDTIASFVKKEDWDSVDKLSQKRQHNLQDFFQKPVRPEQAKKVEQMIRKILSIDSELVKFIELEKKNIFNSFSSIKKNSKANNTYQTISLLK